MISRGSMMTKKQHQAASSSNRVPSVMTRPSSLHGRSRRSVPSIVAQFSIGNVGEHIQNIFTLAKIPQRIVAEAVFIQPIHSIADGTYDFGAAFGVAASGAAAFLANQVRVHTQSLAAAKGEVQAAVALKVAAESSLKALEAEVASLQAAGDKARTQLNSKEREVSEMTTSLSSAQRTVSDLQDKVRADTLEAEKAQALTLTLRDKVVAAEAEAQAVPDQINTLNSEVSRLRSLSTILSKEKADLESSFGGTKDQIKAAKDELARAQKEAEKARFEFGTARAKVAKLEAVSSQYSSEVSRLQSELTASESLARDVRSGLEATLNEMKGRSQVMEATLSEAQAKLDDSISSRTSVESQILVAEKQALADKAAEQEVQQMRLAEHLDRVEGEAEEARRHGFKVEAELNDLRETYEKLEATVLALKSNQEVSAKELFTQQSALREATSALEKQKEKTLIFRNQSEALEVELSSLRSQSEVKAKAYESEVTGLKESLALALSSAASALEHHVGEMTVLKSSMGEIQAKLESVLKRNDELEKALVTSAKALSSKAPKKAPTAAAAPTASKEAASVFIPPSPVKPSPDDQAPPFPTASSFYLPPSANARGMASLVMSARSAAELDQVAPMLPSSTSLVPATAPLKIRKQRTSRKAAVAKSQADGGEAATAPEGGKPATAPEAEKVAAAAPEAPAKSSRVVAARSASKVDSIVKMVVARAKKIATGKCEEQS